MAEKSSTGKVAWDKERTRELFRRLKEDGDMDAREKLVMSHMISSASLQINSRIAVSPSTI